MDPPLATPLLLLVAITRVAGRASRIPMGMKALLPKYDITRKVGVVSEYSRSIPN